MPRRQVLEVQGLAHKQPIPVAVRLGDLLVSGSISGRDRSDGSLPNDLRAEVRNAFDNLEAVLAAGNADLSHVAKLDVLLADKGDREHINEEWLKRFPSASDRPVRHTTEQKLPGGMRIQLAVLAVVG